MTDELMSLQEYGLSHLMSEDKFNLFLQKNNVHKKDLAMFYFLQEKAKKLVKHLGVAKKLILKRNSSRDLGISVINKETFDSWDSYKISIASCFRHRIHLYLTVPKIKNVRSNKVMICLHQGSYAAKEEPMGLTNSMNAYARFFADKGYITVTPDILGFGEELKDYLFFSKKPLIFFVRITRLIGSCVVSLFSNRSHQEIARDSAWRVCNQPYRKILKDNPDLTGIGVYIYELRRVVDFVFCQKIFYFDKEKVMVTGLSHGAVNAGLVLPFEQRIKEYSSVGGGYHFDTKCKQLAWPIYFGSRFESFVSTEEWDFDFYEALCLIFPRKMVLFNAAGDYSGRLSNEEISILKKLYSSFDIEHNLSIIMDYPLSSRNGKRRPHCYNCEVQEIVLAEIEK